MINKRVILSTIVVLLVSTTLNFRLAQAMQGLTPFRELSFADAVKNDNDVEFSSFLTYTDYYLNKSGTREDPIIIWGNGAVVRCILLQDANYVILKDIYVNGCDTFGIRSTGDHVQILNNNVTNSVRMNLNTTTGACGSSSSWHAGIRAADSTDILISGNSVTEVCGEGLAGLRVDGIDIIDNFISDAYSVNLYCDQCENAIITGNYSKSTGNTNYYKAGKVARGISLGAELYFGHTFGVSDILIENNVLENVRGINYISEQAGTPSNIVVRNNSFINVANPLVSLGSWATISNNLLVTATPTFFVTSTPSYTSTMTNTPTVTSTPTITNTPTNTSTITFTPTGFIASFTPSSTATFTPTQTKTSTPVPASSTPTSTKTLTPSPTPECKLFIGRNVTVCLP